MNNINQEQNTPHQLKRLAAQRQLYSDAKLIQAISVILSVPLVIVWSILAAHFSSLEVYAAFWGIGVTFVNLLLLTSWQRSLQEKAAKIQQIFDCDLLQLDWTKLDSKGRPAHESIIAASTKFTRKYRNYSTLQNWYPINLNQLPMYQARIICQRSNVWWDADLRRRYSRWIVIILIALTITVFLIGLIGGLTLEKFLLVILNPLTPGLVFGVSQYTEQQEAATRLDHLRENSDNLWQEVINNAVTPQALERESYRLQDKIYDNRRRNPLIFDWFYSRLRRQNEEQMNKSAEEMVQELLRRQNEEHEE